VVIRTTYQKLIPQTVEGSTRDISKELYDLNYELAFGRITEEQYERAKLDLGKRD
jgi:hypothetical protein